MDRRAIAIISVTIAVVVGLIAAWAYSPDGRNPEADAPVNEVADPAVIKAAIEVTRLGIATSENYVGHRIRLVGCTVKNNSDKPIRMIEVKMVFKDFDGNTVHEYTQRVLQPTQKPVAPGTTYRFEIGFENLPRTWNYHVPDTEITKIGY